MHCSASLPGAAIDDDRDDDPGAGFDLEDTLLVRPTGGFAKTVLIPRSAAAASAPEFALPEGTLLEGFRIVRTLGEGGFGIVYLAYDGALERHVAIKEYLPAALAARVGGTPAVAVRSPRHADAFQIGLRSFVNEARLLARFDHPSLVKVLRFWEGNGTAYMVMPFYEGRTLAHTLETLGRPPDEAQLRAWLRPLLHALSTLHAARCYHRDIAPDNSC